MERTAASILYGTRCIDALNFQTIYICESSIYDFIGILYKWQINFYWYAMSKFELAAWINIKCQDAYVLIVMQGVLAVSLMLETVHCLRRFKHYFYYQDPGKWVMNSNIAVLTRRTSFLEHE